MTPPPTYLGEFEFAVLLAVLQTEDAYAVPIRALIEERTGRPVARGALYTALERLEAKGCLKSRMGDPVDERGGKPRRYFTVTPQGLKAMKATHAALANLTRGLETILEQR
jgi:DNA-binding PadR family transcriptional regulator